VKIEAESSNEAISKAKEMYRKEEIVLDYNDFVEVEFINVDANLFEKSDEKSRKLFNKFIPVMVSFDKLQNARATQRQDNEVENCM